MTGIFWRTECRYCAVDLGVRDPLKNARFPLCALVGDALPDGEEGLGDCRGDALGLRGERGDPTLGNFLCCLEGEDTGDTGCASNSGGIEGQAVS